MKREKGDKEAEKGRERRKFKMKRKRGEEGD